MAKKSFSNKNSQLLSGIQTQGNQNKLFNQVKTLPELKQFLRPLASHEEKLLIDSVKAEGFRDPVIFWRTKYFGELQYYIIDGHNRCRIFTDLTEKGENLTPPQVIEKDDRDFPDLDAVKKFMVRLQLGKRNVTDAEKAFLLGLYYQHLLEEEKGPENKAEHLADLSGVSKRTVIRAKKFKEGLDHINDEGLKNEILQGNSGITNKDIQTLSLLSGEDIIQNKAELEAKLNQINNSSTQDRIGSKIKARRIKSPNEIDTSFKTIEESYSLILGVVKKGHKILEDGDADQLKSYIKKLTILSKILEEEL